MEIVDIKNNKFEDVLNSKGAVLVDFNADWCGPCRMLRPVLDEIASESNHKIVSVNVDDNQDLAKEYGVMSIPCLVLFKDGKEVNRSVGFIPKDEVLKLIGE